MPLQPKMETIIGASSPEPGKAVTFASLEAAKIHWNSVLSGKSRQALERLVPKLLQALLHAKPPALLFY